MVQKQHQLEHIILEFCAVFSHQDVMSITTQEIIRLCEALPAEKQDEIADFARFLLARQEDEAWEPRLASAQPFPALPRKRFAAFRSAGVSHSGVAPLPGSSRKRHR